MFNTGHIGNPALEGLFGVDLGNLENHLLRGLAGHGNGQIKPNLSWLGELTPSIDFHGPPGAIAGLRKKLKAIATPRAGLFFQVS